MPNTLAFNHALAALHKAATGTPKPELRVALVESGVSLFNQMLNRGRTPPDTATFDTLVALLTSVGAAGQALHVHQLKMQQVRAHHCSCCLHLLLLLVSGILPDPQTQHGTRTMSLTHSITDMHFSLLFFVMFF